MRRWSWVLNYLFSILERQCDRNRDLPSPNSPFKFQKSQWYARLTPAIRSSILNYAEAQVLPPRLHSSRELE